MNRPYMICHMLSSINGKIDGDFMAAAVTGREEFGAAREFYQCEATLYGTVTMAETYANGRVSSLPDPAGEISREDYIAKSDVQNYIVSIDTEGVLAWESSYIEKKGRPKAHIIEALTDKVSDAYLSYLRGLGISYIFAGEETLDCRLVVEKLYRLFGIEKIMISGGGYANWSFLQEGLIDELSLIIAPFAEGNPNVVTVFERSDFLPTGTTPSFALKEIKLLKDDCVWLRYTTK